MITETDRRERFERVATDIADPVQRYLRRRASAHDADDAYSETLMTVWRRIEAVPDGGEVPWALGVARKVLGNQRRSASRRLRLVEKVGGTAQDTSVPPPGEDDYPEVRAALDALPDADREVLTLWAWDELEPREIAVVLDTTANAVSLRLSRAKTKLAAELARQNPVAAGQEQVETAEEPQP